MASRKLGREIERAATPAERARHKQIRELIEQEQPDIKRRIRRRLAEQARLQEAMCALKAARQAQGLSLGAVSRILGMDKSNLSKLENSPTANPTVETLLRYADAVGVEIVIELKQKTPSA